MIVRAKSLRDWLRANLSRRQLTDLVTRGAESGFPKLTYYKDTSKLYARFAGEIWETVSEMAQEQGYSNTWAMIANNQCADYETVDKAEQLLVWIAAEEIAWCLLQEQEDPAEDALANHEVMDGGA